MLVASYDTVLMCVCCSFDTADRTITSHSVRYARECYVMLTYIKSNSVLGSSWDLTPNVCDELAAVCTVITKNTTPSASVS